MKTMKKLILLGLFLCAVISAPAVATITITRDMGSDWTYQAWTFTAPPPPPAPSFGATGIPADPTPVSPGTPTADVALTQAPVMPPPGWYDNLGDNHQGLIFGASATVDLYIPNVIKPPLFKIIQVEVVYHVEQWVPNQHGYIDRDALGLVSYVAAGGTIYGSIDVKDIALDDGWRDVTIEWRIPQQYDAELIHLYFLDTGVAVDSIEVATVCVPEPATLLLLGGAGLIGLLRRRRTI